MKFNETVDIYGKDNLAVTFLYNTIPGRILLYIVASTIVSKLFGALMSSPVSKILIRDFVKKNSINMEEYKDAKYNSFNDFFIREIKSEFRAFPEDENEVVAPSDGKLTAYPITGDNVFYIKNSKYDLAGILQDEALAKEFMGGVCLIFRLMPDDYHRYAYIDDGEIIDYKRIKGVLHTVRPISQQLYNVYIQNTREYAVMQTKNFGKVIQMEVGALFVGRITNYMTEGSFQRGEEKGMFEFGGSTVVMFFQKDTITIDDAIYENTQQDKETVVRMGCKIGEKMVKPAV